MDGLVNNPILDVYCSTIDYKSLNKRMKFFTIHPYHLRATYFNYPPHPLPLHPRPRPGLSSGVRRSPPASILPQPALVVPQRTSFPTHHELPLRPPLPPEGRPKLSFLHTAQPTPVLHPGGQQTPLDTRPSKPSGSPSRKWH